MILSSAASAFQATVIVWTARRLAQNV